jgi:hypothetical protein
LEKAEPLGCVTYRGHRLLEKHPASFLGRKNDAERARAELLAAHPNISAELLFNQDWVLEREEDRKLFLDGFAKANVPVCASAAELAKTRGRKAPYLAQPPAVKLVVSRAAAEQRR